MARLRSFFFVLVLASLPLPLAAQSTDSCELVNDRWYKYAIPTNTNYGGPTGLIFANVAQACAHAEAAKCAQDPQSTVCQSSWRPWLVQSLSPATCKRSGGSTTTVASGVIQRVEQTNPAEQCPAGAPPEPLTCNLETSFAPNKFTAVDWREMAAAPRDYCAEFNGCVIEVRQVVESSGGTVWTMEHTNRDCASLGDSPEDGPDEGDQFDGESCVAIGDGEYCASKAGSGQCGYLNDEFLCLHTVPNMGCKQLADGSRVCSAAAESPPAPDNGTPGQKATPAAEFQHARPQPAENSVTVNNYHYFTSSQVAASTRTTTGEVNPVGGGTDLHPMGEQPPPEDEAQPPCEGADCSALNPELEPVDGPLSVAQGYWNRINSSPIATAVSGIAASVPTGECPQGTVNVFGTELMLSAGCDLMPTLAPMLQAAFLAGWFLVAVRIFLSA